MSPQRIQRKRTKGWRMPEGAIYVGRPTKWGNPWAVRPGVWGGWAVESKTEHLGIYETETAARQRAVDKFRTDLLWDFTTFADFREDLLSPLRGHDLACWCPLDRPCHADVLLELANPGWKPC